MGTRSYIALQIEEDEYLTIFCHYNGYPDDNGAILAEHYDKQEKVESLIQLGDLYFLRSKLEPNPDLPHNHSTPQPNVTIAYNRDEGWSDCEAVHKTLDELNDPGEIGIKKRLLGLERVGIVPNEVMPFYCHSRFPGEDVDSFRHLNHENPDAEIALIEWQPIKPVKLKENAHE